VCVCVCVCVCGFSAHLRINYSLMPLSRAWFRRSTSAKE